MTDVDRGTNGTAAKVLVVGAGFAGFTCARRLHERALRDGYDVEVSLVSPEDYLLYVPLLPDVAGGLLDPRHIAVPLAQSLPGVRLLHGLVDSVDLDAHTAQISLSGRAGQHTEHWDRLVLTPGSVTKLFDVPGLAEHARGLKSLAEALYLRDHVLGQLETSMTLPSEDPACRACRTIVVVGASYAGTELVAQLHGLTDAAALHYGFAAEDVRFLLLDTAEQVMPEIGRRLGNRVLDVLRRRGIEVRLGTTVTRVDDEEVELTDGETVPTCTLAWVTGVTASPLISDLGLRLDHGRLAVDAQLRVPGHPDVFAGGDAAAVPDLTRPGNPTPPIAQHAVRQGRTLAGNVAASLGHGTPSAYRHRNLGLVVDLGPGFAVANPLGVPLSGMPAKALTRGYHLAAMPRAANRAQVAADYLTGLGRSRPIVSLGLIDTERARFRHSEHLPT